MGYVNDIRKNIGHDPLFMPSSNAIIYNNGKVLLQLREDDDTWGIHGGALELGETFNEALYRELKEEIGITPIKPELFGIYSGKSRNHIYPNKDEIYSVTVIFFIENYEGNISIVDGEVKKIKWFDIEDLPNNIHHIDILKDIQDFLKYRKPFIK